MESSQAVFPIKPQDLEPFTERASRLLVGVKWQPKGQGTKAAPAAGEVAWRDSTTAPPTLEERSVLKGAQRTSRDSVLLSPGANEALHALRQGLRIGMYASKAYTQFSGLEQLVQLNERGGLTEEQKGEFRAKYHTASAIAVFASAYYTTWRLRQYRAEDLASVTIPFAGVPEVNLQDPVRAVECLVFYYAQELEQNGSVWGELELLKFSNLYFQAVVDELLMRSSSLKFAEPFTNQSYKLVGTEFSLAGFSTELLKGGVSVEFNRVSLEEIVGNRDAKHEARRMAARMLCYDFESKRNPFLELGGFAPVTMGYGEPGTGKSLLIGALATLLHDYCQNLGLPFLFWPMPDTVVSTFQGGSAERMLEWMKVFRDPSRIIYAPIDDAENNLEERSRQGVSAGVREVIAVFLRNTEGAYAIQRGNVLIQLLTNLPDQIDKAVLSRIQKRFYIGGARTYEDFIDQDYLWYRKYQKLAPDLVKMSPPTDYTYLAGQKELQALSELKDADQAGNEAVSQLLASVKGSCDPASHAFFGRLFVEAKKRFPLFSSRDLRNIQKAIDGRILDFELPEEWFQDRATFCDQPYETKRAMILEIMQGALGGISFAELRLQESVKYLNNLVVINESGSSRRIEQLAQELLERRTALKRIEEVEKT